MTIERMGVSNKESALRVIRGAGLIIKGLLMSTVLLTLGAYAGATVFQIAILSGVPEDTGAVIMHIGIALGVVWGARRIWDIPKQIRSL